MTPNPGLPAIKLNSSIDFRSKTIEDEEMLRPIYASVAIGFALLAFSPACFSSAQSAGSTRPPLIPQPREFERASDISLAAGVNIVVPGHDAEDAFAAEDLSAAFKQRGVSLHETKSAARIHLLRDADQAAQRILSREKLSLDEPMRAEGYVLLTDHRDVYVIAHTAEGIFYGAQTLKQLVTTSADGPSLIGCKVRDWPAMRYRGVHDDLSRGPVPTLEFQKKQIRTFAAYKINVYSPYFENTMQYPSNPLPALPGGSISVEDAKALVAYARPYHVTIIPEQEAFGHLHKVFNWQQYAPLAEVPNGAVLAPGQPGSIKLISQWFNDLAAVYPSPFLHVGADETTELGQGQTQNEVKQRGLGAVYIDFLSQIHHELTPLHRRLLFWGDIAMKSPTLVPRLPHDMIAVAWDYDPEPDGYGPWLDPYTHAGMETWVSPGVNNWNRVYPDYDLGLRNIQGFAAAGQKAGSTGLLNTVWDDDGEGLFLEDWYGILYGAAAAWQPASSDIAHSDIAQFQNDYGPVFHGDASGDIDEAQRALIDAHKALAKADLEDARDVYFWVDPWSADGQLVAAKIRPIAAEVRLDAERALTLIAHAKASGKLREPEAVEAMDLGARRIDFLAFKFQTADTIAAGYHRLYDGMKDPEISRHASRDLYAVSGVNGECEDLRDGYSYLRSRFSDVWLMENRPYWLENVTARYDAAIQLWMQRSSKLNEARLQWSRNRTLPTPEELGIPPVAH